MASAAGGGAVAGDGELDLILECASRAARAAGALIVESSGKVAIVETKATPEDLVTETDRRCQEEIEAIIRAAFPDCVFVGEESVAPGAAASAAAIDEALTAAGDALVFIVDPIDGTANFTRGLPLSAVSIGVARRGELLAGVIYEPYRDELFAGAKGRGATLNGTRLHVCPESRLGRSTWGYGLHYQRHIFKTQLRACGAMGDATRGLRALGSAAIHLAYVACGRLSGFWELGLSSWDVAAGALLVQEAGGRVSQMTGGPFTLRTRDVLASNGQPAVHDGALAVLASVGAHVADPAETWPTLDKA